MVKWDNLGYANNSEYENDFLENLLVTNHTYDFFVNQDKIFESIENLNSTIDKLNPLTKVESDVLEDEFMKTIKDYPETIPLLPKILAVRENKVPIMDIEANTTEKIDFTKKSKDLEKIKTFSRKTGLLNLFLEIDDLKSYLTGVEVGLDTNARKNRSGHSFERIVSNAIAKKIKNYPNLTYKAEYTIQLERTKRFDFVIFEEEIPKLVFECNFYSGTGSKPIEVAHSYVDLQKQIHGQDMKFIWITDGLGWKKMFKTLKEVSPEIDYILNYKMFNERFEKLMRL